MAIHSVLLGGLHLRTWDEWVALVIGPGGIVLCWVGYFVYLSWKRRKR